MSRSVFFENVVRAMFAGAGGCFVVGVSACIAEVRTVEKGIDAETDLRLAQLRFDIVSTTAEDRASL